MEKQPELFDIDNASCTDSSTKTSCKSFRSSESTTNQQTNVGDCPESGSKAFIMLLSSLACIGGFLFGYDTGVISGAMILIKTEFDLNTVWQEAVVAVTVGAAAIFSLIAGILNDLAGRRPVILLGSFLFTIGAILMGAAQERYMLIVGRFIVGSGIGLASTTVPMYIAEVSPPHLRGRLVTMNTLFITGGQFFASVLDGGFYYVPNGWRYMLGLAGVPSVIQFIGFLFMPESPRWLIAHGNYSAARGILERIFGSEAAAEDEYQTIRSNHEDTEKERLEKGGRVVLFSMFRAPHIRRALLIGCSLQLWQQVSGINTVMYYSATIIQMTGIKDPSLDIWLAAVTAAVNFGCTFIGVYFVEKVGRRILTLSSLLGVFISLLILGIGFQLMANNSPPIMERNPLTVKSACYNATTCTQCIDDSNCGYCYMDNETTRNYDGYCLPIYDTDTQTKSRFLPCNKVLKPDDHLSWAYGWCPTDYYYMPIVGLILYLFFFAPGMGPMPWTINAEIYPLWARSAGVSMATTTNWIFNLIVSMTYLTLLEALTKQGAYYLYAAITLVGFIFFFLFLPETKGRALEEIEGIFARPWFGSRSERRPNDGIMSSICRFGLSGSFPDQRPLSKRTGRRFYNSSSTVDAVEVDRKTKWRY